MSAQQMPPLAERQQPGLSETLPYPRRLDTCQSCGAVRSVDLFGEEKGDPFTRWMECDEWDRDQPVVVVLCGPCSDRLINPHPRLYKPLHVWHPMPGAMALCTGCKWADALRCTNPTAKINGGEGLHIVFPKPDRVHLNFGGGRGRWDWMFNGPVKSCSGREEAR